VATLAFQGKDERHDRSERDSLGTMSKEGMASQHWMRTVPASVEYPESC